jgi:hypothetical protein
VSQHLQKLRKKEGGSSAGSAKEDGAGPSTPESTPKTPGGRKKTVGGSAKGTPGSAKARGISSAGTSESRNAHGSSR